MQGLEDDFCVHFQETESGNEHLAGTAEGESDS